MVQHHHEQTTKEILSADSYRVTNVGGRFVGNLGKYSQSDVLEESRVPEIFLLKCLHGKAKWKF